MNLERWGWASIAVNALLALLRRREHAGEGADGAKPDEVER
jgi:hypothetical protein